MNAQTMSLEQIRVTGMGALFVQDRSCAETKGYRIERYNSPIVQEKDHVYPYRL